MLDLDEFLNWNFWVATLFIMAALWFSKMIVGQLTPATLAKGWFKAFLTLTNIGWGLVTAIPPDYLKGSTFGQRAMVGVLAGMLSNFAYDLAIKRLLDKAGVNPSTSTGPPPLPKSERKTSREVPAEPPPRRPTPPHEQGP
jgi:hypothetical protein